MTIVKFFFLSCQCDRCWEGGEIIHTVRTGKYKESVSFYCVTVQVCLMQKAREQCFYWSNRYYTDIIAHQGTSYGEIHSSRSLRFTAHTTITHNKQTSLTWKPTLRSPLWYFLMGVRMPARTAGKDALAVKVTFSGFPRFFTCTPLANMKSITWHRHGNRLIFFWRLVVGEIHEGHRCSSRAVNNWPCARGRTWRSLLPMTKRTPLSLDPRCLSEWEMEVRGHGAMRVNETDGSLKLVRGGERKVVVIWRKTALVIDRQTGWVDVNVLAC